VLQSAPSAAGAKPAAGTARPLAQGAKPPSQPGAVVDRIFNGADDNGSGSVALLSIAKAFLAGPRPRRTLVFVWFAGEERGFLGSQYHANYGLPADRTVAMLNLDMIGRRRGNRPEEANTVYPMGSDRVSQELHGILVEANASLSPPLTLDYRHNDAADRDRLYSRSDHVSYASRGIPVIGFTTGLHPDYHRVTDGADRIDFLKMARIARLVYETAGRIANLDHALARDREARRAGRHGS
jgi:Zn-dependent M28 family amino/carboxypeptidase